MKSIFWKKKINELHLDNFKQSSYSVTFNTTEGRRERQELRARDGLLFEPRGFVCPAWKEGGEGNDEGEEGKVDNYGNKKNINS